MPENNEQKPDRNSKTIKVDMHCHTRLSRDSLNDPTKLVHMAASRGMGALCVTDHNALANALELSRRDDLPIKVIPSEEVKTSEGEIIGYFLSELVPKGLTPEETVRRIKGQGGLVGVPHPFDTLRTGSRIRPEALDRLVEAGLVDMLEVFNARAVHIEDNLKALAYAEKHNLPQTAGSDAHTLMEVGRAYVEVAPFETAEEFLEVVRNGKVGGELTGKLIHLGSTFAKIVRVIPGVLRD